MYQVMGYPGVLLENGNPTIPATTATKDQVCLGLDRKEAVVDSEIFVKLEWNSE